MYLQKLDKLRAEFIECLNFAKIAEEDLTGYDYLLCLEVIKQRMQEISLKYQQVKQSILDDIFRQMLTSSKSKIETLQKTKSLILKKY